MSSSEREQQDGRRFLAWCEEHGVPSDLDIVARAFAGGLAEERANVEPLKAALLEARGEVAFMRSCIDSGESLTLADRARLIERFDRWASLAAIEGSEGVQEEEGRDGLGEG